MGKTAGWGDDFNEGRRKSMDMRVDEGFINWRSRS